LSRCPIIIPIPPTNISSVCKSKINSTITLVIIRIIENIKMHFTLLVAGLIRTFETTNIPMHAKMASIKALSENPKGITVKIGNTIQCNKHKVALEIPKISYGLVVLFFISCIFV